jgi:hypothetical protein
MRDQPGIHQKPNDKPDRMQSHESHASREIPDPVRDAIHRASRLLKLPLQFGNRVNVGLNSACGFAYLRHTFMDAPGKTHGLPRSPDFPAAISVDLRSAIF